MVCRQCGRDYNDEGLCTFCGAKPNHSDNELVASKSLNYESNLGFARADAQYEAPLVADIITEEGVRYPNKIKNVISYSQTNSVKPDNKKDRRSQLIKPIAKPRNMSSKYKEKKLAEQRQLRLLEELRARLQEEKQGPLNRYMYQGLNQDIEEKEEVRNKRYKDKSFVLSIIGIITGVLFATILLFFIGRVSEHRDYTFMARDSIVVSTSQSEAETYVFNSKGDMLFKINGFLEIYYTPDHTAAIVYNRNTRYFAYVNAYKMKEFTTPVYSFALSEDGNYILYSISGWGSKYYLMLYDVRQDKETMVDRRDKYFDMLNVLPGGNVFSYCTYSISNEETINDLQSYIIRNNTVSELTGKGLIVFAISMDYNSIYYGEFSEGRIKSLYVRHNGIDKQISSGINGTIFFNKDITEVLVEDNGSYYLWSKDGVRSIVIDKQVKGLVLPKMAVNMTAKGIVRYGIQSFTGKLFLCNDNSIQYLEDNLQMRLVAMTSDTDRITLSEEGKKLFYLDSQKRLIKIKNLQDNFIPEVLAYGVTEYRVSGNMSRVYYIRDDELYFRENNKEEKLICANVRFLCSNSDDRVFFLKDYESGKGTLYYSKDGLPAVAIEGGTNMTGVTEWNFGVIYQKIINNAPAVFYNTKENEFLFIMDGYDLLEASSHIFR